MLKQKLLIQTFSTMNKLRDKKLLIAFGKHLREIRKKKQLSMEKLAIEADVETSQVFRIEKGLVNPTLSSLKTLSTALNISLCELTSF